MNLTSTVDKKGASGAVTSSCRIHRAYRLQKLPNPLIFKYLIQRLEVMHMIRAINVLTLASLLILTGCFGMIADDVAPPAEGQTPTTSAAPNHPPATDTREGKTLDESNSFAE